MSRYSIHFVTRNGQTSVPPKVFDCANDVQALERVPGLVGTEDIELWEGRRLVELFPRKGPKISE